MIDLIFLRYLEPLLRSDVVVIDDRLPGLDARSTAAHLTDVFSHSLRSDHGVEPLIDGQMFRPDHCKADDKPIDYVVARPARAGGRRTYWILHEFLFPDSRPPGLLSAPDWSECRGWMGTDARASNRGRHGGLG